MFTYLLKNQQGLYETTRLKFKSHKQAEREARMWYPWPNLTGHYIIIPVKNIKKSS